MKDVLHDGAVWLADQQTQFAARTISYVRAANSLSFPATLGRSEFEITDSSGFMNTIQTRDYLVKATDFAGVGDEPKAGDVIIESTLRYEVVAPGPQLPVWQWSDQYRIRMRIHTKQIA